MHDEFGGGPVRNTLGESRGRHDRSLVVAMNERIEPLIAQLQAGSAQEKAEAAFELYEFALGDEAHQEAIAHAGGIKPLVALLRWGSAEAQVNAASALAILAVNDANKVALANADAIDPLLALANGGSAEAQWRAAAALGMLAQNNALNQDAIARAGGIELLVALVRGGRASAQTESAHALGNLADGNADNQAGIARAGGIEALVALLRLDIATAQGYAARALGNIMANNATNTEAVADAGGIGPLVELVRSGSDPMALSGALLALSVFAADNAHHKLAIAGAGGIEALMVRLQRGNAEEQEQVAIMLGFLAQDHTESQAAITRMGGREVLEALARDGSAGAKEQATYALQFLSTSGPAPVGADALLIGKQVLISGLTARPELNCTHGTAQSWNEEAGRYVVRLRDGTDIRLKPANVEEATENSFAMDAARRVIEPVLAQLQSGSAGKQLKALKQIVKLAFGSVARQEAITRAGGIEPLVALVRTGSTEAKHYAAHVLCILAQLNAANSQAAIASAGGIEPLVALLQAGVPMAASALGTLAQNNTDNQAAIVRAGAINPLIALLDGGPTGAGAAYAANTLGFLAADNADIQTAIMLEGAIDPLVRLLQIGNAEAQGDAALALCKLALDNADAQAAITRAGGIEQLVALLLAGSVEVTGLMSAACVLGALAEDNTDNQAAIVRFGGREALEELASRGIGFAADALEELQFAPQQAPSSSGEVALTESLVEQQEKADAAMEALLAEEDEEKAKAEAKRSKSKAKKGKGRVKLPNDSAASNSQGQASGAEEPPAAVVDTEADDATSHAEGSAAADQALQMAMEQGVHEGLVAALESHGATASDSVRAEARTLRDKMREKRKKQSHKQKRQHAGAMEGLAALQTASQSGSDAQALQQAIASAESLATEQPEIFEEELSMARERLGVLAVESQPAAAAKADPVLMTAVVLALDELRTATDNFDRSREIGSGGFGKVFRADSLPSLSPQRWREQLRETRLAVKRANQGLELIDLQTEIDILSVAEHAHLLPLFGYCLDAAVSCLIFPLMAGGSLQARLDLKPRDVECLLAMGHFEAAPRPLTWRQKLRAVLQACEALLYLHKPDERKPRTLHRDFKPANILLDSSLHAYLGDTGFAKAAHRSGDASRRATTGRIMCSPGYADEDVINGRYSESSDGFAVGRTLLVVLTQRDPVDIEDAIADEHDAIAFADVPADKLAEPGAGWPLAVAAAIKELYTGLCLMRKKHRLPLAKVVQTLASLLQADAPPAAQQQGEASHATAAPAAPAAQAVVASPAHTPLSLQVRGLRGGEGPERSVQRNVSDAFDRHMRRLDSLFESSRASAPSDFFECIDYWHASCGLPDDVRSCMQTLRIWRNASLHHDDQRWAKDGPHSADEASRHIAELDVRIRALEAGS